MMNVIAMATVDSGKRHRIALRQSPEKMGGVDLADQQLTSYPYKANTSTI